MGSVDQSIAMIPSDDEAEWVGETPQDLCFSHKERQRFT